MYLFACRGHLLPHLPRYGLVPLIGVYVCEATGNIYAGLWYPMTVAAVTFVVGSIFLKETHGHRIWAEVGGQRVPASGD
jgi:hypothetical protein